MSDKPYCDCDDDECDCVGCTVTGAADIDDDDQAQAAGQCAWILLTPETEPKAAAQMFKRGRDRKWIERFMPSLCWAWEMTRLKRC